MFKDKKQTVMSITSNNQTIIAQGVRVEGDFRSQGDVVIDGEVSGSVETQSSLRVGETAKIHADVKAANAVIAGEVQGNIFVQDTLELLSTSDVKGDIVTTVISVAAGAQLNGRISMDQGKTSSAGAKDKHKEEEEP
jgi:cytoskeletal protein CcmA (bactofilin family)